MEMGDSFVLSCCLHFFLRETVRTWIKEGGREGKGQSQEV